jgi:hypothetical protein
MTIAVIWQEDSFQWCAADTRRVAGKDDRPLTEIAAKIYAIPVVVGALGPELKPHQPYYWTQYGFVFAGAVSPASMTAVTASTFLQKLAPLGDRADPPTFEQIAEFVHRLAKRFMADRRQFASMAGRCRLDDEGIFSAALFGWCPRAMKYKIAHIDGRNDAGCFRVELSYPPSPQTDGDPWLVLGTGHSTFMSALAAYRRTERHIIKRVPRRVIDKMVAEGQEPTVGGATSIGLAHQHGFELFYAVEPVTPGQPAARRIFNGLDMDTEVGQVGQYVVATKGLA